MSKWEEITASLKKGMSFVEAKSRSLLALSHLNNELSILKKAREEEVRNLGEITYKLLREGKISHPELSEAAGAVTEYEEKIEAKKGEIDQIRRASQELTGEKEEEQKDSESGVKEQEPPYAGCGHEIPEGANFCPVCGRKLVKN